MEENVIDHYWIRKLDMAGNIINEIVLDKKTFLMNYDKPFAMSYFIKEIIDIQSGYLLIGVDKENFPIWYFDKDFNFDKKIDIKKAEDLFRGTENYGTSGSIISSLFYQNYQFVTPSKKGLHELIVYFTKKKKSISIEVASTEAGKSHSIKELDNEGKSSNLKISWIEIFPARPGEGVISFYQFKKKKITFIKVELE
jgi:hypothetical protein